MVRYPLRGAGYTVKRRVRTTHCMPWTTSLAVRPCLYLAAVRRRSLKLMVVILVVPWEAVSARTALATDPERDTAGRALTCRHQVGKV